MADEQKKQYTFADLEKDLQQLSPEQKQREVICWREDEAIRVAGMHNDPQPYYLNDDGCISKEDYDQLDPEQQSEYKLWRQNGVTVLWEDF